ncbi:hypothetical protein HPB52_010818 [Rhipicephalus sanguineus]|uniref:RNase H type-1 domain-containing protein n=1 Tax=Rhipicephalus sanguineus TaxID=34632 RepID=A0A9D4T9I7_RHISA|nr:hypothetical protein HPB52_010818 [Rhipicephalus sanguineus]
MGSRNDEWAAYRCIPGLVNANGTPPNLDWHTVNHSVNFIDPATGANTQRIESEWQKAKRRLVRNGNKTTPALMRSHLAWLWWRSVNARPNVKDKFLRLIEAIARREAQRASQLSRLSSTAAGRRLLDRAGLLPPGERVGTGPYGELEEQALLSDEAARKIIVYPLPKNTDPERDEGRRAARAVALARQHQQDEGAVYVDAARYPRRRNAFVATVVRATTGELLTASTVRARTAGQAEEVAIALAMGLPGTRTVLSDSKSAIKNFARGTIWQGTERLMRSIEATWAARGAAAGPTIALKWFPAHMGRQLAPDIENRNEEADAAARDLITGNGQCQDATYPEEVRAWIRSEDLKTQRRAIQRLEEALAKQRRKGADDPSNGRGGIRVTVA